GRSPKLLQVARPLLDRGAGGRSPGYPCSASGAKHMTDMLIGVETDNRFRSAPRNADFTIDQDWPSYSVAEHGRWDRLFQRSRAVLRGRACDEFLQAVNVLKLSDSGIPDMGQLSDRLEPMTGWRVVPVAGLVPDDIFFDHLANRRFPAGAFIRPEHE